MFFRTLWAVLGAATLFVVSSHAQPGKIDADGLTLAELQRMMPEYFHLGGGSGRVGRLAIPDVFGPGAVLDVGNIHMKVTNAGHFGNAFPNLSSDPAGQWRGASAIEYLSSVRLAVGGVNPTSTNPAAVRRVSFYTEWRPPTLDPEDRMYRAYDGIVNGTRFGNDDGDFDPPGSCGVLSCPRIDEDFLDGRDNDGDGLIDEDHAAIGQKMYSCVMRDDTPQAINAVFNEKHVPLGLEVRQKAWAYSISGFQDFNVVEYEVFNRSGHPLDSVYVGWFVDMDAGPAELTNYFSDDFDVPYFPSGEFVLEVGSQPGNNPDAARRQSPHSPTLNQTVAPDSALCPRQVLRINGFSVADDNGDENRTPGLPSVLLINHTVDPLGETGPRRVGFRAFRSFIQGTPFPQGGNPVVDQQRYEFMSGHDNINQETGFIEMAPGDQKGDYIQWASVGPWRNLEDGKSISVTIAFAVKEGSYTAAQQYPDDYARYQNGSMSGGDLLALYPVLANALTAQIAYEGVHEFRQGFITPDFHGRETPRIIPRLSPVVYLADCRDAEFGATRPVFDNQYSWFDFDCDYCTGVWDFDRGESDPSAGGMFHKTWNAAAPPPNPLINTAAAYNYSDNKDRVAAPGQDNAIVLAWDNLSEVTPDPKTTWFDFRGYKVWKVSDWLRPVGAGGPSEDDWTLVGEFRLFDHKTSNRYFDVAAGDTTCPTVFIPSYTNPVTGTTDSATVKICLDKGDLWNRQTGEILKPDRSLDCVTNETGACVEVRGCNIGAADCTDPGNQQVRTRYPIGRYRWVDHEVKNGFTYFYSVTAFDSTDELGHTIELNGRRSAVEAEGVVPQSATKTGKGVWVVPNPYRGYARIAERPSSWDLTPNASDPTGTHVDFLGLPTGQWTIRIYTVSGDLVEILKSTDPVNESLRPSSTQSDGSVQTSFNRQQDTANDGQARWNLISRNGQDIVSGIYMFTVESSEGTQRGRFVVIR